ncbi:MAG: TolC family protein [Acidobacteriota bacterium]
MYALRKNFSPQPRAARISRVVLCALTLCGLAAAPPAVADEPTAVTVTVVEPRFEAFAEDLARELELLGVEYRTGPLDPGDDLGRTLEILVGAAPGVNPADADSSPKLIVDPVGWPDRPSTASVGNNLEAAARADFARLRGFLDATERHSRELIIPLDPWLSPAEAPLRRAAEATGFTVRVVDPAALVDAAEDGVLYLPPGSAVDTVDAARALADAGAVGYSSRGRPDVEAGWLLGPDADRQQRLVRRAALDVLVRTRGVERTSAVGEKPAADSDALAIHVGTAHALSLDLPWRLRLESTLVGTAQRAPRLTVVDARQEALANNLPRRAAALRTAAGEDQVRLAVAALRPQVRIRADGTAIDADNAEASFGSRPERLVTAAGEASWILFSEPARAALDVAERLQAVRRLELRELELDLELEAAVGVLELARAEAFEAIERRTLESTSAQLDAARSRRRAGAGGRADTARLEARAAADRQALVAAAGRRQQQALNLNQLLGRPLDQDISPGVDGGVTTGVDGEESDPLPLEGAVHRRSSFDALGVELLGRARKNAPALAAAAEVVAVRERELLASRRAFYLPEVSAVAAAEWRLVEDGAGDAPPELPFPDASFPEIPESGWTLGVSASLPIFTGGARRARSAEDSLDLDAARVLADDAERQVEARMRRALVDLDTAYAAAQQARRAADAAGVAYDVVSEGYASGAESLTTLLDAQASLRTARLGREASRFTALVRWHEAQRAAGDFLTPEAVTQFEDLLTPQTAEIDR